MDKDKRKRPEEDPVEGARDVIDHELQRQERKDHRAKSAAGDRTRKVELHPGRKLIRKDESTGNNPVR